MNKNKRKENAILPSNIEKSMDAFNNSVSADCQIGGDCCAESFLKEGKMFGAQEKAQIKNFVNTANSYQDVLNFINAQMQSNESLKEDFEFSSDDVEEAWAEFIEAWFNGENSIPDEVCDKVIPFDLEDVALDALNIYCTDKGYEGKYTGPWEDCYPGAGPEFSCEFSDYLDACADIITDNFCKVFGFDCTKPLSNAVRFDIDEILDNVDSHFHTEDGFYDYCVDHYME